MACPFFYPTVKADRPQPARTPLGSLYEGECQAFAESHVPVASLLYESCNFGYGRGSCPSFPPGADADAVRFNLLGSHLIHVYERDHRPVGHGEIPDAGILRAQADAFLATHR